VSDKVWRRGSWTLLITSIGLVIVTLDNLVVTSALPVIRRSLDGLCKGSSGR
jgi:hypothetical protein